MGDSDTCVCGHVRDEHVMGAFQKCVVDDCDCLDFEQEVYEEEDQSDEPREVI